MKNKLKEKWEKEFFDKLAEKLEELFPKTNYDNPNIPSKGNRTTALVLNAEANIIFRDILAKAKKETKKEIMGEIEKMKEGLYNSDNFYDLSYQDDRYRALMELQEKIKKT